LLVILIAAFLELERSNFTVFWIRDLETPDTVAIHVGTNDLKRSVNLDYEMGEVYSVVNKVNIKFPQFSIVLTGCCGDGGA